MRACLFHILYFLLCFTSIAQDIDIRPYIKAWQTNDISQTHKASVFYDRLDLEKDTAKFKRALAALPWQWDAALMLPVFIVKVYFISF